MKKMLFLVGLLGAILALLTPVFAPGKGEGDFLAYWSAARLLATGGNPFDPASMEAMQRANSSDPCAETGVILGPWNPPWLSLILLPFSILPFKLVAPFWLFCNILLVGLAVMLTLRLADRPIVAPDFLWIFISCLAFGPTIALLNMGQISSLVLLGLVLGIFLLGKSRDLLAGAAFLLATIKPHLSYLLLLMIFIYVIRYRRWKIALGLAAAALASILIAWLLFPRWISYYFTLISDTPFFQLYTSTLGSFMAEVFGVQYLRLGGILALPLAWPLLKIAKRKSWLAAANFALLVSVPLAPFGYSFDQIVLLPVIVEIVLWLLDRRLSPAKARTIVMVLVIANLILLGLLTIDGLPYYWFFWPPLVLLAIYWIGFRNVTL